MQETWFLRGDKADKVSAQHSAGWAQPIFTYEICTQKLAGEHGHVASRSRPSDVAREIL